MKKYLMLLVGILSFSTQMHAQVSADLPIGVSTNAELPDAAPPNPVAVIPEEVFPQNVVQANVAESAPVTVDYSPDVFGELSAGLIPGSFLQNQAWTLQNNFGFSLGVNEGYYFNHKDIEDPLSNFADQQSSSATSLSASVFTNYARGKSAIHLDYNTGYGFYPGRQNSTDGIKHSVSAAYMYRVSDRMRFQISDQLSSSVNDPFEDIFSLDSSFGELSTSSLNYGYDVFFMSRRHTRNTVTATVSSDVTGKDTNVNVFGSYENNWYGTQNTETDIDDDYYSASVGAGVSQRITSWLSLGSTYSIQLTDTMNDTNTHRVEVGDFRFNLSPEIEVYASGGVAVTDDDGQYRTTALIRAGMTYTTLTSTLYANFSRNMKTVGGFRRMLPSDTFMVGFGKPIGYRVNLRATGYYQRSSAFNGSGHLDAYQAQTSMEYVIASGLFTSINYSYRRQKSSFDTIQGIPALARSTVSAGLHYAWPSGGLGY